MPGWSYAQHPPPPWQMGEERGQEATSAWMHRASLHTCAWLALGMGLLGIPA